MHSAILGIALSTQLVIAVSDQVPKLRVEETCKGSVEADKAMGLALPQTYEKCMDDENQARQQLIPIWSKYSETIQTSCTSEATAAGNASYVDLISCLQMYDGTSSASGTNLRGASRKRPTN
jgi:hypothetical protein